MLKKTKSFFKSLAVMTLLGFIAYNAHNEGWQNIFKVYTVIASLWYMFGASLLILGFFLVSKSKKCDLEKYEEVTRGGLWKGTKRLYIVSIYFYMIYCGWMWCGLILLFSYIAVSFSSGLLRTGVEKRLKDLDKEAE